MWKELLDINTKKVSKLYSFWFRFLTMITLPFRAFSTGHSHSLAWIHFLDAAFSHSLVISASE